MHGVQKCASVLGEDFAWGAKTCLSFGGRFCTGCINVPQIWGRLLHGVHKRLPVLGLKNQGKKEKIRKSGGMVLQHISNVVKQKQHSIW